MSYAELVVDLVEADRENTMYLSPSKLNCSQFLMPNVFDKATIKNCTIDQITSTGLVGVFTSLKPLAKVNIIVFQPIEVMVFYDTKQIEANLKLVGFENIKITDINIKNEETGQKIPTKSIEAQKPKGKRNVDVDIEVTKMKYKETNSYKKESASDKFNNISNNKNDYEISSDYNSTGKRIINSNLPENTSETKGSKTGYTSKRFKMTNFYKEK